MTAADTWRVVEVDGDRERSCASRAEAEDAADAMAELDMEAEVVPPSTTDGGDTAEATPEVVDAAEYDLPGRSVGEDPLEWVPEAFVDEIDNELALNRKGFEVLAHFYEISVYAEIQVPPEETDFTFCRVKATSVRPNGQEAEAFGSAHIDRDDDPELLLELAGTRARKRSLSIATGVGAVAVDELRSEVESP